MSLSRPVIGDGLIFVIDNSGVLQCFALDDGIRRWQRKLTVDFVLPSSMTKNLKVLSMSPLWTGKSLLVACSNSAEGMLLSISIQKKKVVWKRNFIRSKGEPYGSILSDILVRKNQIICRVSGSIVCLDLNNGDIKWTQRLADHFKHLETPISTPIADDGQIFLGADLGIIYSFEEKTGKQTWIYKTDGFREQKSNNGHYNVSVIPNKCVPLVSNDILLAADGVGRTYALNKSNGKLIWRKELGVVTQFALWENNVIVSSSVGIIMLNPTNGTVSRFFKVSGGVFCFYIWNSRLFGLSNPWLSPGIVEIDLRTYQQFQNKRTFAGLYGIVGFQNYVAVGGKNLLNNRVDLSARSILMCFHEVKRNR